MCVTVLPPSVRMEPIAPPILPVPKIVKRAI
jgi:hypothetical protein